MRQATSLAPLLHRLIPPPPPRHCHPLVSPRPAAKTLRVSFLGENQDEKEASTWATVLVAIVLIAAMFLCSCCVFCLMKYHVEKRHRGGVGGAYASRSPPRKSAVGQNVRQQ